MAQWRRLGRPEAALVGVQFVAGDYGGRQGAYVVHGSPWAFAGTGLANGASFGQYGFEIDARSPQSPPGTQLLASIPNLMGPGRTAEMTYYETPGGAKVFAAGALNFTASIGRAGRLAARRERLGAPLTPLNRPSNRVLLSQSGYS